MRIGRVDADLIYVFLRPIFFPRGNNVGSFFALNEQRGLLTQNP